MILLLPRKQEFHANKRKKLNQTHSLGTLGLHSKQFEGLPSKKDQTFLTMSPDTYENFEFFGTKKKEEIWKHTLLAPSTRLRAMVLTQRE